jgi:hypothetical protein
MIFVSLWSQILYLEFPGRAIQEKAMLNQASSHAN